MLRIERAKIDGLFGYIKLDVNFIDDSPITIISGPNGIGKTHFLRLLHALVSFDLRTLARVEFGSLEVRLEDRATIRVKQVRSSTKVTGFTFSERKAPARAFRTQHVDYVEDREGERELPPFIIELPDGTWYDTHLERYVSAAATKKRYGIPSARPAHTYFSGSWLEEFYRNTRSILIDTQRLDNSASFIRTEYKVRNVPSRSGVFATRIRQYIDQVSTQLSDARQRSLNDSLKSDQTFVARVLQAKIEISEEDLKDRYQRIADQHAELHASGLNVDPLDVKFPEESTNETERRFLNVYLDDWERKLQPLLPTHEKLKALRRIVESKFIGKEMLLDTRGNIRFISTYNGKPLPVHSLSSGEQHLLAVFTMLLFSAAEGALVLIDEPEISMHAVWKHSFVNDIAEVASLSKLQIVLATHSSAIINGRWDLVREIKTPQLSHASLPAPPEFDESDNDE